MAEEVLLGFDAREMPARDGRPESFLLRTDLDGILSADLTVWPSVLAAGERPEWIGANYPFWEDLDALVAVAPPPYLLVAATWHSDIGFERELRQKGKILGPHLWPTRPEKRDPAWELLGFDIADPGISGLSNCGYDEEELPRLRAEFGPGLNRYHLFEDVERALAFRAVGNARVKEHAPFFVIGLWRITDRWR